MGRPNPTKALRGIASAATIAQIGARPDRIVGRAGRPTRATNVAECNVFGNNPWHNSAGLADHLQAARFQGKGRIA